MNARKALWLTIGLGALALGAIGIALPLLPTTPFLLLAAFAFARSSERWHSWLLSHRMFGPMIKDWQSHGAIDRRAKVAGLVAMAGVIGLSLLLGVGGVVLAIQTVVLTGAAAFVLSRPAPPGR